MTQIRDVVLATIPSPCFVLEEGLEQNLAVLNSAVRSAVQYFWLSRRSPSHSFPLIRKTLQGVSASSLWEVQLAAGNWRGGSCVFSCVS